MIEPSPLPIRPLLTRVIATIGPATRTRPALRALIEAGATIFRLNFSHGTFDQHADVVKGLRAESAKADRVIAIMGDLPGPKIRVGEVAGGDISVQAGDTIIFQRAPLMAPQDTSPYRLASACETLVDDVKIGERLYIADGVVQARISSIAPGEFTCEVIAGGIISSGKGINLPDTMLRIHAPTERDRECARWAVEQGLDCLAQSYVRTADEVVWLRGIVESELARLNQSGGPPPIIAKIEHPAALGNIHAILEAADGIIIARGDLGVEAGLARVPVIQRILTASAQAAGKPCLVATHMLESMIHAPAPTRAEVSDVANAVFAGVDGVMLSGETAIGKHATAAVSFMAGIAREVEDAQAGDAPAPSPPLHYRQSGDAAAALAHGAFTIAADSRAVFIAVWSECGTSARLLSQNNFMIPILAFASNEQALRRMQIHRGVFPVKAHPPRGVADFVAMADKAALDLDWARLGDACIVIAADSSASTGRANTLAVHTVGGPAAT